MNASVAKLQGAWAAFGAFLRGFVGMTGDGDSSLVCNHPHHDRLHRDAADAPATAASARAALTTRAARRPSCC